MATAILTALDLTKNELQNLRLQNLGTDISGPLNGLFFYRSDTHKIRAYIDGAWEDIATMSDVTAGGISQSLFDAKGDILVGTADDTVARKAVGANGTALFANSGTSDGLEWRTLVAGDIPTLTLAKISDSGALAALDTVGTAQVDDGAITLAKLADIGESRFLGRATAGPGVVEELTDIQVRTLLNVEDGATADQTAGEIKTAYESNADTNAFTDAEQTKVGHLTVTQAVDLDAIETRVNELDASVILMGTWDASAGTFPGGGTAQAGESWIVSVGGTVDGVVFVANDRIVAIADNASTGTYAANWHKLDYTDAVLSVDGQTGAVDLSGDYQPLDADLTALAAAGNSVVLAATTASFTSADETKLDGIETGATADQNASEVPVTDTGGYFTATDVEGVLQEVGAGLGSGLSKFAANIGGGATGEYVVTHNLNTRDVQVEVARTSTPWDTVLVDVERTTVNSVTVRFSEVQAADSFRVTVVG